MLTLDNRTVVNNGTSPIMLEPVKATLSFKGRKIAKVNILDQDGKAAVGTISSTDGSFAIDTSRDKTIYYQVVFEP
jgi:hypothetical protein